MKNALVLMLVLSAARVAYSGNEYAFCTTLAPDSAALERAIAEYAAPAATMRAAYAKDAKKETQLDVIDVLIAFDSSSADLDTGRQAAKNRHWVRGRCASTADNSKKHAFLPLRNGRTI